MLIIKQGVSLKWKDVSSKEPANVFDKNLFISLIGNVIGALPIMSEKTFVHISALVSVAHTFFRWSKFNVNSFSSISQMKSEKTNLHAINIAEILKRFKKYFTGTYFLLAHPAFIISEAQYELYVIYILTLSLDLILRYLLKFSHWIGLSKRCSSKYFIALIVYLKN